MKTEDDIDKSIARIIGEQKSRAFYNVSIGLFGGYMVLCGDVLGDFCHEGLNLDLGACYCLKLAVPLIIFMIFQFKLKRLKIDISEIKKDLE